MRKLSCAETRRARPSGGIHHGDGRCLSGFKPCQQGAFTAMYCQQAVVEHAAEDVIEPLAGCFFRVEVVVRQIAPGEQQGIAAYGFAVCRLFWPVLIQVTRFRVRLFKKVPRQAEQVRQPAMRQPLE